MELEQHIVEGRCGSGEEESGVEAQSCWEQEVTDVSDGRGKGVVWQQEKEEALNWYTGGG